MDLRGWTLLTHKQTRGSGVPRCGSGVLLLWACSSPLAQGADPPAAPVKEAIQAAQPPQAPLSATPPVEPAPSGSGSSSALSLGGEARAGLVYAGRLDPGWAGAGLWLGLERPLLGQRARFQLRFGASPLGWETTLTASASLWHQRWGRLEVSLSPSLTVGTVLAHPALLPVFGLGGLGLVSLQVSRRWSVELSARPEGVLCPSYSLPGSSGYLGLDVPVMLGMRWASGVSPAG